MRNETLKAVETHKLISIVRGVEDKDLIPLAEAMYRGGIRLLEITYDAGGKTTDEEIAGRIERLVTHFDGRMFIGSGTVLTEKQVSLTKAAGGAFVISPDACCNVIAKTRELEMVSIPGALTPTEIQCAHRCGADFVKLFPIDRLGVDYVKAIRVPLSHIRLLAVGGVTVDNMHAYLQAGVVGFGIGSNLIDKGAIRCCDFAKITEIAERYVGVITA